MRTTTLACLVAVLLGGAGCTSGGADRAGGKAEVHAKVITMAQPAGLRPSELEAWANEVAALSGGHLKVEFNDRWHWGAVDYESHTIRDVQHGVVDSAWVGARVLDRVGVTAFQPLVAPLLVDSYDLEGRVFDAGIPDEMLASLQRLDVVGIGVLPGPMRKMLGVGAAFTGPSSFRGKSIAMTDSAVAAATFTALGATGRAVGGSADLDRFDGLEQQLDTIYRGQYNTSASFVTGNLNLWPRPLVMLMNRDAYRQLGHHDQQTLREAAQRARGAALDASRAEEQRGLDKLCQFGMSIPAASDTDLAGLRTAVQPVYTMIRADADAARWLARIEAFKAQVGAPPERAACASTTAQTGPLDGVWQATLTAKDWSSWPQGSEPGRFRLSLERGTMSITDPSGSVGYEASFRAFKGRFQANGQPDVLIMAYTLDGDTLRFSEIRIVGDSCADCSPYSIVLGSHPWLRVHAR
jgi:TRAP-type C4-dicarboxylate transport system substrate-binding protein